MPDRVAVVMTVFNAPGEWLREAVDSALEQLREGDELIVWDDGSDRTDTIAAIDRLPARVTHVRDTANRGIAAASNEAIALTDAPMIARLDADDHLLPGALNALRSGLSGDVVSGGMIYIRPDGTRFKTVAIPAMERSPKHRDRIVHSGCVFRRSLWERVGGYPPMRFADWHFWEAAERAGATFSVLDRPVIERRIHTESFSFKKSLHLQRAWKEATR